MTRRVEITVLGCVQGVGFRPTVYRHALELGLAGSVRNGAAGVQIEVEGDAAAVAAFLDRLRTDPPPQARIDRITVCERPPAGQAGFRIAPSARSGDVAAGMPPDLALCDDCRAELLDPGDRRHRYAFINCTNCGPRFTIIESLPYDRERTSMRLFEQCPECAREYHDPADRRFDAQPNACPRCGPRLRLVTIAGQDVPGDPLAEAVRRLAGGAILAVKGVGGFHLCSLAADEATVARLRERKARPHKPLAVMFADLAQVRNHAEVDAAAVALLTSPARPVVILSRRPDSALPAGISPDSDDLGAFLPYTPLHELLLAAVSPLVMTSANRAEEPICADLGEVTARLGDVAEFALDHDRRIVRRCDDSVVRALATGPLVVRRSRGYVPAPVHLPVSGPTVLACGAELKNTFCVTRGDQAFLSQHVGDLTDYAAYGFYREALADLVRLLDVTPQRVAHDLHPDYLSTRFAREYGAAHLVAVQHHHAHVAACLAEHGLRGPVIGVAMDGTGYGPDGTVWGGEFLVADLAGYRRVARLAHYRLPGGDQAVRYPARMALSCLVAEFGDAAEALAADLLPDLAEGDRHTIAALVRSGFRAPLTSSAGRLFDAVSALLGLCGEATYEGQAAVRLQTAARRSDLAGSEVFAFHLDLAPDPAVLSLGPALHELLDRRRRGVDTARLAAIFHRTLAAAIAETCREIRDREGLDDVVLSGGVFQNDLLLVWTSERLAALGFRVRTHRLVPPNDGGIALGQAAVALALPAGSEGEPPRPARSQATTTS